MPGASAGEADVFFSRARNPKIYRDAARAHPPASDDARADARSPLLSSPPRNYQGCFNITTVFSHSQTVVLCGSCSAVLCQPTWRARSLAVLFGKNWRNGHSWRPQWPKARARNSEAWPERQGLAVRVDG